jgi:Fe2+ transport system protein B
MYSELDKSTFFNDLKNLVIEYIQTRLELTRLSAFEKIAKIVTYLIVGFVLALFFFFGLFFLSLMLGFYLSDLLDSQFAGFGIVAGMYFGFFFIFLLAGNSWMGRKITDNIIRILFEKNQTEIAEDE